MIKVKGLNWNQQREEHILRHKVSPDEVEEVVFGKHYDVKTKQGRYRLIGQTENGRYLVIVLEPSDYGWFDPVTARDATKNERKLYLKKIK